jgi:hypothetical protein
MDSGENKTVRRILSLKPSDWNLWLTDRDTKEDKIQWKPYWQTNDYLSAQVDTRVIDSDQFAATWRDLKNICLQNEDFSERQLCGLVLAGSNIQNTTFRSCSLRAADLSRCVLRDVSFRDSLLYGTNFSGSKLHNVDFSNALIYCADFDQCAFSSSTFRGAKICPYSLKNLRSTMPSVLWCRIRRLIEGKLEAFRGY